MTPNLSMHGLLRAALAALALIALAAPARAD